jgi:hypothetical protein
MTEHATSSTMDYLKTIKTTSTIKNRLQSIQDQLLIKENITEKTETILIETWSKYNDNHSLLDHLKRKPGESWFYTKRT